MAAEPAATSIPAQAADKPALTLAKALEIIWACAWECAVLALLIRIVGGVTLEVVGDLWHEMTPSMPPGLAPAPVAEAQPPSPAWQGLRHLFQHHSYAIIFAIVFLIRGTSRLRHYSGDETEEDAAVQVRLLCRRLTRRWIRLVVVNAFVAFGGAIALQFMQQFSLTSFVWQFLGDLFHPVIHTIAQLVPGSGTIGRLASW